MIRQYDVFPNPLRASRGDRPFVVSLQHRMLDHLPTRLVAPLVVDGAAIPLGRLTPTLRVNDRTYRLSPYEILPLAVRLLGAPVANLEAFRSQITAATDLVFLGV